VYTVTGSFNYYFRKRVLWVFWTKLYNCRADDGIIWF